MAPVASLAQAKAEAARRANAGDYPGALHLYDAMLAAAPLDDDVRFSVAHLLAKLGLGEPAAALYRALALHGIRAGRPLRAVVAVRALEAHGQNADDLLIALAGAYSSGSPHLAKFAARPAPLDPATPVPIPDVVAGAPLDELAERAAKRALDLSAFVSYATQFHPLPFLSDLGPEALLAVLKTLRVLRLEDGQVVVRQGEPGQSLYLVAAGELRVLIQGPDGVVRDVARLHENTLFGEMALITEEPRAASVAAVGPAEVVEVSRAALAAVIAHIPTVAQVLDRFARERLIKNILSTSPLFTPFTKQQQADLLRRFEGMDVDPDAEIIREGWPGQGLYIVLTGAVEVVAGFGTGAAKLLAQLKSGDVFGEMSLLSAGPTTATVRATRRTSLLFLERTYFERLVAAIPEVAEYFQKLATERALANTSRDGEGAVPEEPMELDASDVIYV